MELLSTINGIDVLLLIIGLALGVLIGYYLRADRSLREAGELWTDGVMEGYRLGLLDAPENWGRWEAQLRHPSGRDH